MKRRGRGIACMWYPIGFTVAANPSAAVVKINEDGTATLLTGTVETGQGSLTILAQIVAQELGIATDDVHVVSADTDTTPMDTGAMRGFGAPQVCFAYESHMDDMAKDLGLDPLEMRLMNALEEGSLSPTSQKLHSVVVKESLLQAAERFGWKTGNGHGNGNRQ